MIGVRPRISPSSRDDWGQSEKKLKFWPSVIVSRLHFKRPAALDGQIRQAIGEKKLIEVRYKARVRVVEPHDYGRQNSVDRLLVFQLSIDGVRTKETGWRLLEVRKIESLDILETAFKGSRRQRNQHHHAWDVVYARVE
jgi:hypothetical protein